MEAVRTLGGFVCVAMQVCMEGASCVGADRLELSLTWQSSDLRIEVVVRCLQMLV